MPEELQGQTTDPAVPEGQDTQSQAPQAPENATGGQDDGQPSKTFTQEELNGIAAKEAKKAQEKTLRELGFTDFDNAKEGLAKYKEFLESQKSDAEKQAEQLSKLSEETKAKDEMILSLNAKLAASSQGVKSDALDDVIELAKLKVSDEVTIEDAIKSVLEKYPHFAGSDDGKPSPKFGNAPGPKGGDDLTEREKAFRQRMGLN